jgi:hypothetical protein
MVPKKKPKKRTAPRRVKLQIDASRLALAALERIKTICARTDRLDKLGQPTNLRELAARASLLDRALPPSYVAAVRVVSSIGEPEVLLSSAEMSRALKEVLPSLSSAEAKRYLPFAATGKGKYAAFDRSLSDEGGELAIAQVGAVSSPRPLAHHFGEWLDEVADTREESIASAAVIPQGLRNLLLELGFRFEDPIVGRLETGDVAAMEELLGPERTREVRGTVDRLFDSSGKASLTLNVDEFTLAVSLRTGIFVCEADEVFRWLRGFRDENFFGEPTRRPSHPDYVHDLSKAPREPPLVLRGCIEVATLPARRHTFRAASGRSADDFYLLGRTSSTSDRAPSVIMHVVRGQVRGADALDEPLNDLYVTQSGTMWGLSLSGTAVRFSAGLAKSYALNRPTRGRPWWYGIGGDGERVLVWGAGALLEFKGDAFVPFSPDAELADSESVVALCATKREIAMLVFGDRVGAVARFDGARWLPIPEEYVVDGVLTDLDVWRGIGIVLARSGDVWRVDDGPPRPVIWDKRQQAFIGEGGTLRPTHCVRGYDGGALLASDGGTIVVGSGDPVFYSAGLRGPARLARVGQGDASTGIVALCGPHAWLWRNGNLEVLDVRDW